MNLPENKKIEAIFFDVGNVLLKINWQNGIKQLPGDIIQKIMSSGITPDAFNEMAKWDIFYDYESGFITSDDFEKKLTSKLGLNIQKEEFKTIWCSCLDGEVDGIFELVHPLSKKIPCFTLSNTNELHYDAFKTMKLFSSFEKLFASHLFQSRKPSPLIYEKAINALGIAPEKILFFDDLEENIESAKELGINAHLCKNSASCLREILVSYNLI